MKAVCKRDRTSPRRVIRLSTAPMSLSKLRLLIEVVQEAVDRAGMDQVPVTDSTRLLSDNGLAYVSRSFRDYLGVVGT